MDWPKTPENQTDWEAVFEHPTAGLIPLVSTATSPKKLHVVTTLLVEQLFLRDSDAAFRAGYLDSLNRIFGPVDPQDSPRPLGDVMPPVVDFLRAIKTERIARAGPLRAEMPPPPADEGTVEQIFAAVFCDYLRARFEVLTSGMDKVAWPEGKPPFILSQDFADRFVAWVNYNFFLRLADENRGVLIRAENQAPTAKRAYLEAQMNDQKFRTAFLNIWADIWKDLTQQKRLPQRPEETKPGVLAKLFGKGANRPALGYMSPEAWDEATAANKRARRIWAEIVMDTGDYLPPLEDDNRLLMNLPGRTPGSLQKQVAAIAQIVVQGASRAAFESFQNGRDIDLALLVASFRHPGSMLGPDGFTLKMLGSYPDSVRRERYPLVSRYILDEGPEDI